MWKSVLTNLKQLVLIVFSVILGILLSERIEEKKNEKEAELLLSKIKSEVQSNKQILEDWLPYHDLIVNRLDSIKHEQTFIDRFIEDEYALYNEVITNGNLMGDMPSKDAWDIAKSHPLIVHFDYEKLLILSKIYNQQELTYVGVPQMIELFLSADFNSPEKAKANIQTFSNQMREVRGREISLLNYMNQADSILSK